MWTKGLVYTVLVFGQLEFLETKGQLTNCWARWDPALRAPHSSPKALVLLAFQLIQCASAAEIKGNIPIIMQFMEVERGFYKQEYMFPDRGDNIHDKQPLSGTSVRCSSRL